MSDRTKKLDDTDGKYAKQTKMKPKTELFLYTLMWGFGVMGRSSLQGLDESFEGWAWRKGLLKRVQQLEASGYVDIDDNLGCRVINLTESGRILALGGVEPPVLWDSPWDGKWRLFSFDLPESERKLRRELRQTLRQNNFGCLQRSLWITPHALGKELLGGGMKLKSLKGIAVIEGVFRDGASNEEIVTSAWDFSLIERLYKKHAECLKKIPRSGFSAEDFNSWAVEEMNLWRDILHWDPFLPRALLPRHYSGCAAWDHRLKVLKNFAKNSSKIKL